MLARQLAPPLRAVPGVVTAATVVGQTADARRFKCKDAYARHTGASPQRSWRQTAAHEDRSGH